jgi:6-hydroxymethylpterin diphosphokinase MptE-like protein
VKGAHDLLCEHDLIPDFYVALDPRDRRNCIQRKNKKTLYLMASRNHPDSWQHLKGCNVILWHPWSSEKENEQLRGRTFIGGGTTSGLRALSLGYCMGYRKFILYGYDSCLAGDGKTKRFTGETVEEPIDVIVDGRKFLANIAMAAQANEFQMIYKMIPDITIESRGDGLISAILAQRRRKGLPT